MLGLRPAEVGHGFTGKEDLECGALLGPWVSQVSTLRFPSGLWQTFPACLSFAPSNDGTCDRACIGTARA